MNIRVRSYPAARKHPDNKPRDSETMIHVKSIFTRASDDDGFRILVEPFWPRRARHEKKLVDVWLRDLAPSPGLYDLYSSNMVTWEGFVARYHEELGRKNDYFPDMQSHISNGGLTLVHGSRNEGRNTAVALKMLLETDRTTL